MPAKDREIGQRQDYLHFLEIPTRWMDNDIYGHVNNTVYYSFFDTAINRFLIDDAGLDIHGGDVIGLAVESMCRYHASFAYPETVTAGLRIASIGNSSVRYEVGLFGNAPDDVGNASGAPDGSAKARAEGYFVHVFVSRETRKPVALPDVMRAALSRLLIEPLA